MRDQLAAMHDRYLEPPVNDYEAQIESLIMLHAPEIDMVLEILEDLRRDFDKEGFDPSEFVHAATAVSEVCREVYPGFTTKDRLLKRLNKGGEA